MTEAIAVPTEPQEKATLAETAKELFGDEYHEPSDDMRMDSPTTLEGAFERMQDLKDEKAHADSAQRKPQPVEEQPEQDEMPSQAMWSTEDVRTFAELEKEAAQYQQDLAAFQKIQSMGIDELAKGDKAKAAMLRTQMKEAEKELGQRFQALSGFANGLQNRVTQMTTKQAEKYLTAERAKLDKELPGVDKKAVADYLKGMKISRDQMAAIGDHKLIVMAEKARRYDEMQKGDSSKKFPKLRTNPNPALNAQQKVVKDAKAKLVASGSLDDALALVTAQKRKRA